MSFISNLFEWLKKLLEWLIPIQNIFYFFLIILISLFYLFISSSESCIRIFGLWLQICAIALTIHGLLLTRKFFYPNPIYDSYVAYLKCFPKWNKTDIVINGVPSSITITGSKATVVGKSGTKINLPNASNEEKFGQIENLFARVFAEFGKYNDSLNSVYTKQNKLTDDTKNLINNSETRLRDLLANTATSGIVDSILGLVVLLLGTIFSTIPSELYSIFSSSTL